jgi:hypothetical protein
MGKALIPYLIHFIYIFILRWSCYLVQASLEFLTPLLQPPKWVGLQASFTVPDCFIHFR